MPDWQLISSTYETKYGITANILKGILVIEANRQGIFSEYPFMTLSGF